LIYKRIVYDAIFVIINKFSKIIRYLIYRKNIDTPAMARLLYKKVFLKINIPRSIILDRGTLFTLI
jgi:hypothetical protein